MKLCDLGEKKVIETILEYVDESDYDLGKDDDIAVVQGIALKIDGFSVHNSMLPWNSFYDMGWKASTMVASDLIAKGVRPLAIVVSIGAPGSTLMDVIVDIIKGVRDSAHYYNMLFVGGDTNAARTDIWVDASGIGVPIGNVISRKGAMHGDYVVVTGLFGLTGAAFHAYKSGYNITLLREKYPEIITATRRPRAPLYFLKLVEEYGHCISSSTDVSDGLAFALNQIAFKNNVAIRIESLPLHSEAEEYAQEVGVDPYLLALYGGEEFEVLFTVRGECKSMIKELVEKYDVKIIGSVMEGQGVYYGSRRVEPIGWDHFRENK